MALIRVPYPLQWGRPSFHAGDAVSVIAASFVALIESTGKFIAASRYASATPIPPSVHSRGVGWLEVAILLNGLFGTGTGSTASVENAGLLGLTRVRRRRVVQISVLFMLFLSVFGTENLVLFWLQYHYQLLLLCTVPSLPMLFNNVMRTIFSSPATVAIMVAFFLDCTHSYWHDSIRRDNGSHWWEKFRSFNADTRTENFYSLPANLNRFFPSF
ncbi:hypothetical protein GOBAR_AA01177 [Gossypium barbadense]|uniref:Uncharacterized protein n=1 Tax=Gossypium barbadense TaxID=3634 RepID=A0A2P5YUU6_GOSBA|nr:hypothetical protein GOBAR_AA01177 [Gossypium barbadense]